MTVHVVKQGETIDLIANQYGVSVKRLILDNELTNANDLVPGQTIVVVYPEKIYIVKKEDTLIGIANENGISVMQLLRNNPYLFDREYLHPGDTLVISYQNDKGKITTSGYAFPFISKKVLQKTLPNLTYLSIYNYGADRSNELLEYYDESEIIQTAKEFGVAPLLLFTTLSIHGETNVETAYEVLMNRELQNSLIENIIQILKKKGYYGINITLKYINTSNQIIYFNMLKNVSEHLSKEGFPLFLTVDPGIDNFINTNTVSLRKVNYAEIGQFSNCITLMNYVWGNKFGPPSPILSVSDITSYLDYIKTVINTKKIGQGFPVVGYDWELPYIEGYSKANAISQSSIIQLACDKKARIQFDDKSKTPFFEYVKSENIQNEKHIVWFMDARTIDELMKLVKTKGLQGIGVWSIMEYYAQLWLMIHSSYEIDQIYPLDK